VARIARDSRVSTKDARGVHRYNVRVKSSLHQINADLHAHSTVSDGTMTPRALVERAHRLGVGLFALTDHDEVSGLREAALAAAEFGLDFVPGVEISVTWRGQTVHVVGLGIDPDDAALIAGLSHVRSGRMRRAQAMAEALADAGHPGALEGALAYAGNVDLISRTHFARWLVEIGAGADVREVFSKYLVAGKPGYVPHQWAELDQAVAWIARAGGIAIVAHPGRYRLDDDGLHDLLAEFRDAGGRALEVATSNHTAQQVRKFAQLARQFELEASRGSDFHGPNESQAELGRVHALPDSLMPVWGRFV
jgi:predicted metal-dependent phosphoesterase TrpH